jgi:hypothetical protein
MLGRRWGNPQPRSVHPQYAAALEADLSLYHHHHLALELGTPRLTWRRLGVLIRHMPRGSALHRAMDPEGVDWDVNSELLAADRRSGTPQLWQRGGAKGQSPKPVRRPSPPGERRITWAEKVRLYEEHKAATATGAGGDGEWRLSWRPRTLTSSQLSKGGPRRCRRKAGGARQFRTSKSMADDCRSRRRAAGRSSVVRWHRRRVAAIFAGAKIFKGFISEASEAQGDLGEDGGRPQVDRRRREGHLAKQVGDWPTHCR